MAQNSYFKKYIKKNLFSASFAPQLSFLLSQGSQPWFFPMFLCYFKFNITNGISFLFLTYLTYKA